MEPVDEDEKVRMSNIPYQQAVGSLMYASITFRPDIIYVVNQFAQFCKNSGETHWKAAKKVLRYIASTQRFGLQFSGSGTHNDNLTIFSDADYAGETDTRR